MEEDEFELLDELFDDLFPICRSITGPGLRESLDIISEHVPLEIESVPSGTDVFDWTIPKEWRINKARLLGPEGEVYADFEESNLHVMNYSEPVDKYLSLEDLKPHLYTDKDNPEAIPYVTSYYKRRWGFCISHETFENLPEGEYHAYIDSEFVDGSLNYGHTILEGRSDREFLLSSYLCHPSLANNELSGPLVLTSLYKRIKDWEDRYYTYRFVLCPETIGSIAYLYNHGETLSKKLVGGLVLTCLGGPEVKLSYKTTRKEDSLIDKTIRHLKKYEKIDFDIREFTPTTGSDERQYCSPGFDLPVGQMARTVYGEYKEYHRSIDDKEFMGIHTLVESADVIEDLIHTFEKAGYYRNLKPYGEPMLGKRNLYPSVGGSNRWGEDSAGSKREFLHKVMTVLNYSDGAHSMIDIAERYGCSVKEFLPIVNILGEKGLIEKIE